jgi:acyl-CoA synthetase (AMP-forming)/AMP-acid ligase II/acyl carrier protein
MRVIKKKERKRNMRTLIEVYEKAGRLGHGIRFVDMSNNESYVPYDKMYDKSKRILTGLHQQGIKKGDKVILQLPDNYTFVSVFWACILGGIVAVPVPVASSESEYERIYNVWKILEVPRIITNEHFINDFCHYIFKQREYDLCGDVERNFINVSELLKEHEAAKIVEVSEDDIAYLQFSSGSTAEPKGVILTHRQIIANLSTFYIPAKLDGTRDTAISWMPLTHDMGIVGFLLAPMYLAMDLCLVPPAYFVTNPLGYIALIDKYRYTATGIPNFGFGLIMRTLMQAPQAKLDLSCLRLVFNGAEPISVESVEKFCAMTAAYGFKPEAMYPVYGLAEAVLVVGIPEAGKRYKYLDVNKTALGWEDKIEFVGENDPQGIRMMSVGGSIPPCSLRIADKEDKDLPDGYAGQIMLKGKSITQGYYGSPISHEEIFDQNGWYRTGDIGFLYDDNIYVVGRIKDIIFSNGRNYYSSAIEKHVESLMPQLYGKIVVCGINNLSEDSDKIVVFIITDQIAEEFIKTATTVKVAIAEYFGIIAAEIIPTQKKLTTAAGKIQRFKYVEEYNRGAFGAVTAQVNIQLDDMKKDDVIKKPDSGLETELHEICAKILAVPEISVDENFAHIGADSLKIVMLYNEICVYTGRNIAVSDIYAHPTIRSLAAYLNGLAVNMTGGVSLIGIMRKKAAEKSPLISWTEQLSAEVTEKILGTCEKRGIELKDSVSAAVALSLTRRSYTKDYTIYLSGKDSKMKTAEINAESLSDVLDIINYMRLCGLYGADAGIDQKTDSITDKFFIVHTDNIELVQDCFDLVVYSRVEDGLFQVSFHVYSDAFTESYIADYARDCINVLTNIFIQLYS